MPIRRARCGRCQAKSADNTLCCKGERRQWRIQRTEAGAAVAECEGILSPKHDAGTATRHYRTFWQRNCRAAHRAAARRFGAQPTLCGGSWRGDPPERCLSRQAGIVRYCLKYIQKSPPAKQLAGLFFGFLGFRLVAHVRYRVHGDERPGVFAVHEVHQLLVLALVHDGDDLAAFFHVVGTVGFIHRGPAVQVG